MKRVYASLTLFFAIAALLFAAAPAAAENANQAVYFTPTPEANGNIYYIVRENDTCTSIALLHQISEGQLLQLNNMAADDCRFLIPGKKMIIAIAPPATPTPQATAEPTAILPTPTPFRGTGQICVLLFDDLNGDGLVQDGELPISNGAVSITNARGDVSLTGTTGSEPVCYDKLDEGTYNISVAPPEGYNPTTSNNYNLQLAAGDQSTLNFGAQLSGNAPAANPEQSGVSPLIAIFGFLALLGGVGLAYYAWRMSRKPRYY